MTAAIPGAGSKPRPAWRVAAAGAAMLAIALLAGFPRADAATQPAPLWGFIGLATPTETSSDAKSCADAKFSVLQAIDAIDRRHDGRVVEIGFATKNGTGWYTALVANRDGLRYLRVDPANGQIGKGDRPGVTRAELDAAGRRDLDALGTARIDLRQAVAAVEQSGRGTAISAGIEQLGGIPQYYVRTWAKGHLTGLVVDPGTGRITAPS
jgi:uncharacterized membrane protein YkoI